jgi:putative acetyltransferase
MTRDQVEIREERPADYGEVAAIHRAAFGGDDEAVLVEALRKSGDAAISLVAASEGRCVGHVLFSRLDAPVRSLALAPLAVRREWQREGIGSALVEAGLAHARKDGFQAVFVVGSAAYYERFGFSVDAARGFSSPYAGEHFMMTWLGSALVGRGSIRYARAFDALR